MKTFVLNGWSAAESAWSLCLFPRDAIFDYIDQLDGLSERAVQEAEDGAILVGWSMGGSTALRIATKYPDRLRALVLVAATPRMMKDKNWAGMSERRLAALEAELAGTPEGEVDKRQRLENRIAEVRRKVERGSSAVEGKA